MLDIKFLRNDPESVRRALQNRGGRYVPALEDLLAADAEWKAANGESEPLRARRNQAADEMGRLKREKKDATALLKEMEELKTRLKGLDDRTAAAQARVDEKVLGLPNLPHPSVPVGADAGQNREIRRWGEPKKFPFKPRDHQDIGEKLGVLDMARAAKLSGARFALLSGA
ncbi:MAG TPA: serine--tRNA ligase, partial [Elusimicrobiota bacterium]|nr:serine--tRNA ligase [Elusimicrobiota bacterium]